MPLCAAWQTVSGLYCMSHTCPPERSDLACVPVSIPYVQPMIAQGTEQALRCAVQPATSEAGPGTPQSDSSAAAEEASRTVYFARVPPCVPESDIHQLFSRCGPISNLQLFRPWSKARSSKGCGLVEFATPEGAEAALAQLNGTRHWPEAFSPLLVERRDSAKGNGRTKHRKKPSRGLLPQGRLPPAPASSLAAAAAVPGGRSTSPFTLGYTSPADAECDIGHGGSSSSSSSSSFSSSTSSASKVVGGCPQEPQQLQMMPVFSMGHTLDVVTAAHGMGSNTSAACVTLAPTGSAAQGDHPDAYSRSAQQLRKHWHTQQGLLSQPAVSAAHAGSTSGGGMQPSHAALQLSALTLCEAVTGGGSLAPPAAGVCAPAGDAPSLMPLGHEAAAWAVQVQHRAAEAAAGNPTSGSSTAPAVLHLPLPQPSTCCVAYTFADSAVMGVHTQGMPVVCAPAMLAEMPLCAVSAAAAHVPVHLAEDWPQPSALLERVPMACQHRMLLKLTHPQASVVALHAQVLGRVTGTHVSFTVSMDGAPVVCVEGSNAQVVQAQSLILLLL